MELATVRVAESPSGGGRVRLVGEVLYDDRPGKVEPYWFEFPEKFAGALSVSGNPWLACLLPLAVTRGEKLRLRLPVDPLLLSNASRLMEIWSRWYPDLRPVALEAEAQPTSPGPEPRASGGFFSGGIDSFYMVLRDRDGARPAEVPALDTLVLVRGFDIPVHAAAEFERHRESLLRAADDLGLEMLDVATNLRIVRFREADWGRLSHGSALASVGLAAERRFQSLCIAATHYDGPVKPWGSQPETDPLLSTGITRIFHVGVLIPRREKTEYIARSDVALRHLHVCYRLGTADNCCDCFKCLLAMLTLEVVGALDRCPPLRRRPLDLRRVRKLFLNSPPYLRLYRDLEARARAAGREDVADAIAACLRRSRRLKPVLAALAWGATRRGIWRISSRLRRRILESPSAAKGIA
jgi:hypothetical protein